MIHHKQIAKIVSWNVNGLNEPKKRNIVFNWLKKQNTDILCLQETHINYKHSKLLKNKNLGEEFISADIKKKRGVVIYENKNLNPSHKFKDDEGRMVAIELDKNGGKTLLVNIYAPNGAKERFFCQLRNKLEDLVYDQLVVIGDFNGVIDSKLNKFNPSKIKIKKKQIISQTFTKFMNQENLSDVWRMKNPSAKDYTYYSPVHKSFSRIDMMWASQSITVKIRKIEIVPKIKLDHNPII